MRSIISCIIWMAMISVGLLAQAPSPLEFSLPPVLVEYLALTNEQVSSIARANEAYERFVSEKNGRAGQVYLEITQETAKPTLDAMALGLRYLELEAIRRESEAERQKTFNAIQNVLSAAQKSKLATLEEALRLQSTACLASSNNLIQASSVVVGTLWPLPPYGSFVLANSLPAACGISVGVPGGMKVLARSGEVVR